MIVREWSAFVPASLSNYLRDQIERRGITQQALADASGLKKGGINYIIKHPDSEPDLETLQKLANGLGITLGRILVICGYDPSLGDPLPESERIAAMVEANPDLAPLVESLVGFEPDERQKILGYIEAQLEKRERS